MQNKDMEQPMVHHSEEFGWEPLIFALCPWIVMDETSRLVEIPLSSRSSIVENCIFSSTQISTVKQITVLHWCANPHSLFTAQFQKLASFTVNWGLSLRDYVGWQFLNHSSHNLLIVSHGQLFLADLPKSLWHKLKVAAKSLNFFKISHIDM